ncbi:unnamed protein product [Arabidopsis thaliana]|uniref:Uncharacterized protein n=1 Tax=Arabidopsis thaliana TaxID=3702 RepID=A0A5S9XIR2_ARATH|nr:unnamed protein product [Arabidopsis thaliana]
MEDETRSTSSLSDITISIIDEGPLSPLRQRTERSFVSHIKRNLQSSGKPLILLESAGKASCCIFRIPDSLAEVNPKAYKPKVVSIGPYHYGENHLQMIQQHKFRFLELFVDRATKKGMDENVLYAAVGALQHKIRASYSEELRIEKSELVSMMILDGCFILMLLLIVSRKIDLDLNKDPIFTIPWIFASIQSDLLLLENQVPFFVLQTIFDKSGIGLPGDLNRMAFSFFNLSIDKPEKYWARHRYCTAKHLLDLNRMTFIPTSSSSNFQHSQDRIQQRIGALSMAKGKSGEISSSESTFPLILSAKRLRLQGIKFRLRSDAESILDIKLKKNKLQIPLLRLDGFISSIFLNCVAFEQFYTESTNDITTYVVFMGCLLNDQEDATFLNNDKRIIENYFGNENEVSQFFKTICKDVVFDTRRSYLRNVFEGVNEYTSKTYNGVWAGFRHTHFESPWTALSSFAVVLVMLLAMTQAAYAIRSYYHDTERDGNSASP